jgi:hypothetical protein
MTRRQRGRETERIVADWFARNGWPYALPNGSSAPGPDVTGMPGLDPECKARRDFEPTAALRQLEARNKGAVPFAVMRPDGFGPARVGEWVVCMRLDRFTQLLRDAGYGS